MKKEITEFELDGQPVYIEVEPMEDMGAHRISRNEEGIVKSDTRFDKAISQIRPVADALLKNLQEITTPEEVALEFGIKFNAKAGAVFASVDSEATFKVSIKWKSAK
jgi:hypothetical protein